MENRSKSKFAILFGYASILGASMCCVIPFIFLSIGLAGFGAGFFEIFSPYQNWFLGFSFVSIIVGLYFARQKKGIFIEGKPNSKIKFLLWLALMLLPVLYFWKDQIEPLLGG